MTKITESDMNFNEEVQRGRFVHEEKISKAPSETIDRVYDRKHNSIPEANKAEGKNNLLIKDRP